MSRNVAPGAGTSDSGASHVYGNSGPHGQPPVQMHWWYLV
jgi:hypothetical protein